MTRDEIETRLGQISAVIDAMRGAWPVVSREIEARRQDLIGNLITQDNEQERGAIKELRNVLDLPSTLQQEREALAAALSEMDAAN